ncbi:MAG TPA: TIGR02117 family protein [Sphingobium sp.]
MRWLNRRWARALLLLTALPLLIAATVLGGSLIPANRGWIPPRSGVTIYVYSNGVHTGLVLPAANPLHDWRTRVRADDLADPRRAGAWLLFGWGQRDFYLNTPHWSDVKLSTVFPAMIGSDRTLMHIDHLQRVWTGTDLRPVVLTPLQYRALTHAIETDFAPGTAIKGYGADDVFYPAHGRYSAVVTCNEWTGAKLRAVGVRIGIWTPAAWSVMRWFPEPAIQ